MVYYTASAEDTAAFGAALAAGLCPGDCVLLRGDLGAGKSVLARGVARGLGVTSAMPNLRLPPLNTSKLTSLSRTVFTVAIDIPPF